MRVTFAFACLFAAVYCLPPPPPPPIPVPNYRHASNNNIYNNRVVHSQPTRANNQYQPPATANNRYQLQPKPNIQYQPPLEALNLYQQRAQTYQPPISNTNNNTPPRALGVPVVTRTQPAPPAAPHSWVNPRTPVASPVGYPMGPGSCQYCSRERPEPRCGINNVTYENDCFLKCGFMRTDCDGPCPCSYQHPLNSGCWCRREDHDPVCAVGAGAQSKTLASQCEATCERLRVVYDGPCWEMGMG